MGSRSNQYKVNSGAGQLRVGETREELKDQTGSLSEFASSTEQKLHKTPSEQRYEVFSSFRTGRWSKREHFRFLEALKQFGKDWKRV
jgi:hypothetical protein